MAGKTVGNTTSKSTEGALRKTEYKFRYTATRDKYAVVIGSVIAAVILVVLCIICNAVGVPLGVITIGTIAYIVIELFVIMCNFLSIYGKTFSVLIIRKDEIVSSHGWLTKGTTTIPATSVARGCNENAKRWTSESLQLEMAQRFIFVTSRLARRRTS